MRDDLPDTTNWLKVVSIVQAGFREGNLAKECTFQTVFLIPKRKVEFRGVGLVEVLWKEVASLLNLWLTVAITYPDVLHGFWAVWGTSTAAL